MMQMIGIKNRFSTFWWIIVTNVDVSLLQVEKDGIRRTRSLFEDLFFGPSPEKGHLFSLFLSSSSVVCGLWSEKKREDECFVFDDGKTSRNKEEDEE